LGNLIIRELEPQEDFLSREGTRILPRIHPSEIIKRRRRRTASSNGEYTFLEVKKWSGTESEITVVIGSAANLDGIDDVLDWPG